MSFDGPGGSPLAAFRLGVEGEPNETTRCREGGGRRATEAHGKLFGARAVTGVCKPTSGGDTGGGVGVATPTGALWKSARRVNGSGKSSANGIADDWAGLAEGQRAIRVCESTWRLRVRLVGECER